jgi:hypothetical protein
MIKHHGKKKLTVTDILSGWENFQLVHIHVDEVSNKSQVGPVHCSYVESLSLVIGDALALGLTQPKRLT